MPLTYPIDENLRGDLLEALISAGLSGGHALDVIQVGDSGAPALGTKDAPLLIWCEDQNRILVSRDLKTLPEHLAEHLAGGRSSPGILNILPGKSWHDVVDDLVLLAVAADPDECRDRIIYIPL